MTTTTARSLDWHVERQGGIGASEVAAILGLSPWATPRQVAAIKTATITEPPPEGSLKLWLGTRLEPVIAELFEGRTGETLRRPSGRFWHPTAPLHCELDYRVSRRREAVECKVANFGEEWGPDESQAIPKHYYPQVMAQLAVTGFERCHVAVLYHGQEFRKYTFERDEQYIADLVEYVTEWWDRHIVRGEEVAPLGADIESLRRQYPRGEENELVATPEVNELVERLRMARLNAAQAVRQEDDLKAAIIERMGLATRLVGPDYTITHRQNKDSVAVNWEQVAAGLRADLLGRGVDAGTLDAVVSLQTVTKPGATRFVPTWKKKQG